MKDKRENIVLGLKAIGYSRSQANDIYFRYSAWDRISDLKRYIKAKERYKIENVATNEYME